MNPPGVVRGGPPETESRPRDPGPEMEAPRMRPRSALLVAALALSACASQSDVNGVPAGRPNALVQGEIDRRIGELRFLHGQALLESMMRLAQMGDPAMPQIRAGARSDDWLTRASLAWVMGAAGD